MANSRISSRENSKSSTKNENKNFGTILTNDEDVIKVDGGYKSSHGNMKNTVPPVIGTGYDNDFVSDFNNGMNMGYKENYKENSDVVKDKITEKDIEKDTNKDVDKDREIKKEGHDDNKFEKSEKYDFNGGSTVNTDNKHNNGGKNGNNGYNSNNGYNQNNSHDKDWDDKYENKHENKYDIDEHDSYKDYEHKHENDKYENNKHETNEHETWKKHEKHEYDKYEHEKQSNYENHENHKNKHGHNEWTCDDVLCETEFDCNCNPINEALADIVESIAHQENGIAKILDSESKKICRAICMAECVDDLLKVNKSVQDTIKQINNVQIVLISKLQEVSDICDGCYDDDCGSN